jgi:rhodanese-related sulfurtransferase
MEEPGTEASEISSDEARALLEDGAQLIDVRVAHEWDAGRITGATHLPLEELADRSGELDKERPVVIYCRTGIRSSMATDALGGAGFNAVKLSEGILGWEEAGLGLDPEDGYVAESGEAASILQARKRAGEG